MPNQLLFRHEASLFVRKQEMAQGRHVFFDSVLQFLHPIFGSPLRYHHNLATVATFHGGESLLELLELESVSDEGS